MNGGDVIPIYKNKGNKQCCTNYFGVKIINHTMKLWKRVLEQRQTKDQDI